MKNPFLMAGCALAVFWLAACNETTVSRPAPVTQLGLQLDSAAGAVMVKAGDTVWSVSQRYRLPLRDIVDINGLQPPYALREGQRLLLPRPLEHKVGYDDTLVRVARMYDVSLSELVKINRLTSPYLIRSGQQLRIPSTTARIAEKEQEGRKLDALASSRIQDVQRLKTPGATARDMADVTRKWAEQTGSPPPLLPPQPAPARAVETTVAPLTPPGKFIWPVQGKVISSYGPKQGGLYNDGINIAAPRGTPVLAAADGEVAYVGSDIGSYGNLVLIRHGGGMVTAYAHMSGVTVRKGERVRKGQSIGAVGTSGTVANAQLHFEVRQGAKTLDPRKHIG